MSTKRFLNKVVFIKSANINYQEVLVDGNVHFTGDQGVGKSTVLRAILFFYNADSLQLGIPRSSNKEAFADYYFAYANSHIIYEVTSGYAQFCVWLFKEHNKLCYRFINAPFEQSFFLEQTVKGSHPRSPEQVLEQVRAEGHACSRKILRFSEFRDILYGAIKLKDTSLKTFRQYALMESSVYHNIPKTIGNVFLNSKLQSDAIKSTIINSISEDEFQATDGRGYHVDLDVLRSQLGDFKQDYDDIADFEKIKKRAERILKLHALLHKAEEEQVFSARQLGASAKTAEKSREELETSLQTQEARKEKLNAHIERLKQQHRARAKQLSDEIAIQRNNIAKAEEKRAYYEKIGIAHILQRVAQEERLKMESAETEKQKRALEAEFESLEQQYQVLFDRLSNERERFANGIHQKMNALAQRLATHKQRCVEEYQLLFEEMDETRDSRAAELEQQRDSLRGSLHKLEQLRQTIQTTPYFQEEIERVNAELAELRQSAPQQEAQTQLHQAEIRQFEQQEQHEEEQAAIAFEHQKSDLLRQQKEVKAEIEALTVKLQSFENSLYEFLNQRYPGWENTIGKVCDERILFENDLRPAFEHANELLYGVKLDLQELEPTVKTLADYEKEREQQKKMLQKLEKDLSALTEERGKDQQRVHRKFQRKVREEKKSIATLEEQIEQAGFQIERLTIECEDLRRNAERKRAENLEKVSPKIVTVKSQLQEIDGKLGRLKTRYQREKQQKKQERDAALKQLAEEQKAEEQNLKRQLQTLEQSYNQRQQELEERKYADLQGKGLDTAQLRELEAQLASLSMKLQEIEGLKRDHVGKYQHDKEEYLDRRQEFENRQSYLERELRDLEAQFSTEHERLKLTFTQLNQVLEKLRERRKDLQRQQQDFEEFRAHDLYRELEIHIVDFGSVHGGENLSILIGRLKDLALQIKSKGEDFRSAINTFVSPFRDDNIFHFPKQFLDNAAYYAFGDELREFIEEEKIERAKQDVKKIHADLIKLIVMDIDNLTSRRKEVEDTIARMNKDFERSNFVGVVQKVELTTDDSENRIVQTLQEIKRFNDEQPIAQSDTELFTGVKFDQHSDRAFTLLTTLIKNLTAESKRAEITLADTFELKFRVVENQKDTGWQKKLTDIGSNGTDILVKAMIYIMLLNVFKEKASKKFKDFTLHCIMDEIGVIHPRNIESLITFANERGIWMINGSPVEHNALAYRHVYDFSKNAQSITTAARLITQN